MIIVCFGIFFVFVRLFGVFGRYVMIWLDEVEVKLIYVEVSISRDDVDYLDIDGVKEVL